MSSAPTHSLVLVHAPGHQAREDFEAIAAKVRAIDDSIQVFVASNDVRNFQINHAIVSTPTLVFSPLALRRFVPRRGKVYVGGDIDKLEQYRRFVQFGIRTPRTAMLSRDKAYPTEEWGERVVLKPFKAFASSGRMIYLIATKRLNFDLHIRKMFDRYNLPGGVMVQEFVNSGPALEYHRSLALFGEPLYTMKTSLATPVDLDLSKHPNETLPVANQGFSGGEKRIELADGPELRDIAARCFRAFPERALLAIDILKSRDNGEFYVLEVNPGGNTWHFSSAHIAQRVKETEAMRRLAEAKIGQFGAFDVAARVLAERTLAEAE